MRKITVTILPGLLAAAFFLLPGCGNKTMTDEKPAIAVSILPQEYFVSRIAGDLFSINVMIPPGASPATYEPTPAQLTRLSETDLYLKMGYTGFEMAWMEKLHSTNNNMTVVNLSDGVDLITEGTLHNGNMEHQGKDAGVNMDHQGMDHQGMDQQDMDQQGMDTQANMDGDPQMPGNEEMEQHGHHHGGIDPHTWLSPKNVKIIVRNIHDALAAAYPGHKDVFAENLEVFMSELDSLDRSITKELSSLGSRAFFTYHPSLSYFARDYNLEQYPLELGGKTPSSAHMKQLIDTGHEKHIGVVFLQMQFDQKNAEVLAKEIGAEIVQINPLDPEWYDQMLFITAKLKENLQ